MQLLWFIFFFYTSVVWFLGYLPTFRDQSFLYKYRHRLLELSDSVDFQLTFFPPQKLTLVFFVDISYSIIVYLGSCLHGELFTWDIQGLTFDLFSGVEVGQMLQPIPTTFSIFGTKGLKQLFALVIQS